MGTARHRPVNIRPTISEILRPMDTMERIWSVSRFPQYWAARISMAPPMPEVNSWIKVWIWPPIYTPDTAASPKVLTIRLSAKETRKVITPCSITGMESVIRLR